MRSPIASVALLRVAAPIVAANSPSRPLNTSTRAPRVSLSTLRR
jgi:hypothetical protein